jgi:adenosylhomocysteine nucleosidase
MAPGIVAAMMTEARILAKGPIAPGELTLLPEGAMLSLSGIGANRARVAAQALLEKGATALVSWGSAGGLMPALPPGSLVLPERILVADQSVYPVDPIWHEGLCSRLKGYVDPHRGVLVQSTVVLTSRAEKAALLRRTGAVAVDMESASIAQVAKEAGIPFMAIRAIADGAQMDIPRSALDSIDEFGRVRPMSLLSLMARHPVELFVLLRMGRNFRAAKTTLARVALRARSCLLCPQGRIDVFRGGSKIFPVATRDEKL